MSPGGDTGALFQVAICTRGRPDRVTRTLLALLDQEDRDFQVLIVDQSDEPNAELADRSRDRTEVTVLRDDGRGLSRGRNLAARVARADWIAFIDDDCVPDRDWSSELRRTLTEHPDAWFVSGHVREDAEGEDYLPVSAPTVLEGRRLHGRWTPPWEIGLGVFMAVRRSVVDRLGGWDERFGVGGGGFPAAEDMDFNYRLLRAGGIAYVSPSVRATHEQWRTPEQLGVLYRGYLASWAAFSMKHLRLGDVSGGLWLWQFGLRDIGRLFASALRRRSPTRLRVATMKLRGFSSGTIRGLARSW